ncbi:hypothetical protein QJQ45_009404 [Haematococcus lacustris]|nr:hypothetical protein QJQ45_009404 [Haematococcus lacustris]
MRLLATGVYECDACGTKDIRAGKNINHLLAHLSTRKCNFKESEAAKEMAKTDDNVKEFLDKLSRIKVHIEEAKHLIMYARHSTAISDLLRKQHKDSGSKQKLQPPSNTRMHSLATMLNSIAANRQHLVYLALDEASPFNTLLGRGSWLLASLELGRGSWLLVSLELGRGSWLLISLELGRGSWLLASLELGRGSWLLASLEQGRGSWLLVSLELGRGSWLLVSLELGRGSWLLASLEQGRGSWLLASLELGTGSWRLVSLELGRGSWLLVSLELGRGSWLLASLEQGRGSWLLASLELGTGSWRLVKVGLQSGGFRHIWTSFQAHLERPPPINVNGQDVDELLHLLQPEGAQGHKGTDKVE